MVATTFRNAAEHDTTARGWPRPGLRFCAILLALLISALTIDALIEPIAPFDVPLTNAVQGVDLPGLSSIISAVEHLTSSEGAIALWLVALLVFAAARAWLPALAIMTLPIGGVLGEGLGALIVQRTRPDSAIYDIQRSLPDIDAFSFPSGHVMGAVLFYGLIFFLAGKLHNSLLRTSLRTVALSIILLTGFARIWEGAHWPTDVLAAYSLGGLLLVGLIAAYRRIDAAAGHLPFVHAGYVPHDEQREHAHALTSTVFFQEETVSKVYAPGFVPRALYWLAYQAEFPYIRNRAALEAAQHRRNLAALLTEYWYGQPAVARVTAIEIPRM